MNYEQMIKELSEKEITDKDVLSYVLPNAVQSSKFKEIFDRFDNVGELQKFMQKEFINYKENA